MYFGRKRKYAAKLRAQERKKPSRIISLLLVISMLCGNFVGMSTGAAEMVAYCGMEEHTHSEACYCAVQAEGESAAETLAAAVPTEETAAETTEETTAPTEETALSVSGGSDAQTLIGEYVEKELCCGMEEHKHDIACYSNPLADLETAAIWEATLPEKLSGDWGKDLAEVAKSQLGYAESAANYLVGADGETLMGYSRYGAWYSSYTQDEKQAYADWNVPFLFFCLYYAGVEDFPIEEDCADWTAALAAAELWREAAGEYIPEAGDLVFLDTDDDGAADRAAVVTDWDEAKVTAVESDSEGAVKTVTYDLTEDTQVLGYGATNEAQAQIEVSGGEDAETLAAYNSNCIYLDVSSFTSGSGKWSTAYMYGTTWKSFTSAGKIDDATGYIYWDLSTYNDTDENFFFTLSNDWTPINSNDYYRTKEVGMSMSAAKGKVFAWDGSSTHNYEKTAYVVSETTYGSSGTVGQPLAGKTIYFDSSIFNGGSIQYTVEENTTTAELQTVSGDSSVVSYFFPSNSTATTKTEISIVKNGTVQSTFSWTDLTSDLVVANNIGPTDKYVSVTTGVTGINNVGSISSGGNYKLTSDIYTSSTITLNSGVTIIDLDGHGLYYQGTSNFITVQNGATLIIKDSQTGDFTKTASSDDKYGNLASVTSSGNKPTQLTYYVTEPSISGMGTIDTLYKYTQQLKGFIVAEQGNPLIVKVENGGTVSMRGGTLFAANSGGTNRIVENYGEFNMNGGYICGANTSCDGAAIFSGEGSTLNIMGGVIAANTATSGGAIYTYKATLNIGGGKISGNTVKNAGYGGGVYAKETTTTLSGGYITNNRMPHFCGKDGSSCHGGGGIATDQGSLTMTGGYVTGNYSSEAGGGMYVGLYSTGGTPFAMSGGIVASNYCENAEGGGIRISGGSNAVIRADADSMVYVTNNTMNSDFDWGGGGIFVQTEGKLVVYETLVTNNQAGGFGGGVAACPTGETLIVQELGAAIYGNTAAGDKLSSGGNGKADDSLTIGIQEDGSNNGGGDQAFKSSECYSDYYCVKANNDTPVTLIMGEMLGGGDADWNGRIDNSPVSIEKTGYATASWICGLKSTPTSDDKALAQSAARVIISGNTSYIHGGGIMTNGDLILGDIDSVKSYAPPLEIRGTKGLTENGNTVTSGMNGDFTFLLLSERPTLDTNGKWQYSAAALVKTVTTADDGTFSMSLPRPKDTNGQTYYLVEEIGSDEKMVYDKTVYEIETHLAEDTSKTINDLLGVTFKYYYINRATITTFYENGDSHSQENTYSNSSGYPSVTIYKGGDSNKKTFQNTKNLPLKLCLTKNDGGNAKLSGAEFTLKVAGETSGTTVTTGANGIAEFTNLSRDNTTYYLYETKAPDGYAAAGPWIIELGTDSSGNDTATIYPAQETASGGLEKTNQTGTAMTVTTGTDAIVLSASIANKAITSLTLTKAWQDASGNELDTAEIPESIDVQLQRRENGKTAETDWKDVGDSVTLNKPSWSYTFQTLDKYVDFTAENRVEWQYRVVELYNSAVVGVDGTAGNFEVIYADSDNDTYVDPATPKSDTDGNLEQTITNKLKPKKSITVNKVWKAADGITNPTEVTVKLQRTLTPNAESSWTDVESKSAELNASNNWTCEFTELDVKSEENEYSYRVVEVLGDAVLTKNGDTFTASNRLVYEVSFESAVDPIDTNKTNWTITNTAVPMVTLDITKLCSEKKTGLNGVSFLLEKMETEDNWSGTTETVSGAAGKLTFTGLTDGEYRLTETHAADGYSLLASPITFTITKTENEGVITYSAEVTGYSDVVLTDISQDGVYSLALTVYNKPQLVMPPTGGVGGFEFWILGGLLIMAVPLLMYTFIWYRKGGKYLQR